jgi:hypothetical protein
LHICVVFVSSFAGEKEALFEKSVLAFDVANKQNYQREQYFSSNKKECEERQMKMRNQGRSKIYLVKRWLVVMALVATATAQAQVDEPVSSTVYDYLYRMAQKGLIRWQDYQLPLDRRAIAAAIEKLSAERGQLTKTEEKELAFYQQEYAFDNLDSLPQQILFFRKDEANRWRAARFANKEARIMVDPVIGLQGFKSGNKTARQYFYGIRLAGYFGKRWGFNFFSRQYRKRRYVAAQQLFLAAGRRGANRSIAANR